MGDHERMSGIPLEKLIDMRRYGAPPPDAMSVEEMLLYKAVDAYIAIGSPFDGVLEAPEYVAVLYGRYAADISRAAEELRQAMRPVLEGLHEAWASQVAERDEN